MLNLLLEMENLECDSLDALDEYWAEEYEQDYVKPSSDRFDIADAFNVAKVVTILLFIILISTNAIVIAAASSHPRLYFNSSEIQELKDKISNPELELMYDAVKENAYKWVDVPYGMKTPDYWGYYKGGGSGVVGMNCESHSGNYSAFLKATKYSDDDYLNIGLIIGNSNGYTGENAYGALPNTTYNFSFWMKGNFKKIRVRALTWNTVEAKKDDRVYISTSLGDITPTDNWAYYTGTFTTNPDTKRLVLFLWAHGDKEEENLGIIYVDDVVLDAGEGNIAENPGAENGSDYTIWDPSIYDDDDLSTQCWAYDRIAYNLADGARDMAFVYLMEEDERFGNRAKEYLQKICDLPYWVPKYYRDRDMWTALQTGHITRPLAETYDWVYPLMSEEEKDKVRAAFIEKGLKKAYYDLQNGRYKTPGNNWIAVSHGSIGLLGLAILGEIEDNPELEPWLPAIEDNFEHTYIEGLGKDGGCGESVGYQEYGLNAGGIQFIEALKNVKEVDLYQKEEIKNAYTFPLFAYLNYSLSGTYTIRTWNSAESYTDKERNCDYKQYVLDFGDGDAYTTSYSQRLIAKFASAYNNPYAQWFYKKQEVLGASDWRPVYPFLWYDPAISTEPPYNLSLSRHFKEIGWIYSKSGWSEEDIHFAFKSGPYFTSHNHADQNTFSLFAFGEPLIIDAGCHNYKNNSLDYYYRGTLGHNTILINGDYESQERGIGKNGTITEFLGTDFYDEFTGSAADVYKGKLNKFNRTFVFMKPHYLVMFDSIESDVGDIQVDNLLHAHDNGYGSNCIEVNGDVITIKGKNADAKVKILEPSSFEYTIKGPFHTFLNGQDEIIYPSDRDQYYIAYHPQASASAVRFLTVTYPQRKGETLPPITKLSNGDTIGVKVERDNATDIILFNPSRTGMSIERIISDGDKCMLSLDTKDEIERIAMHNGKQLSFNGKTLFSSNTTSSVALKYAESTVVGTVQVKSTASVQMYTEYPDRVEINGDILSPDQYSYDIENKLLSLILNSGDNSIEVTQSTAPGTLLGTVSSAGKPIPNATVTAGEYETLTNESGSYHMKLPPGTYTVTASAEGYEPASGNVTIAPGNNKILNFSLSSSSSAPPPSLPHTVYGFVFLHNGTTPAVGVDVALAHEQGNLSTCTASDGSYTFNLGNLPAYNDTDGLQITASSGKSFASANITVNTSVEPQKAPDLVLNIPPSISLTSPVSGALTNSSSVTLQWTSSDDDGDDLSHTVILDGSSYDAGSSSSYTLALADGTHTWKVVVSDSFVSVESATRTFTIDTTPPVVTIDPVTSPTNSTTQTISGSFIETGSGIARITVNGIPAEISGTTFCANISLSEGENIITVIATDKAGNSDSQSTSIILLKSASISLAKAWNLLSLPLNLSIDAETFGKKANATCIVAWNNTAKSYTSHVVGTASNLFDMKTGHGYWVSYPDTCGNVQIEGLSISNVTYDLKRGWNLIGSMNGTAEEICSALGSSSITIWDASSQKYISHVAGLMSNNFDIARSEGCWVWVDSDTIIVV